MSTPILRMQGICKSYGPGIIAADDVSFTVDAGEIHALAGENGAGKTTLMKILFGMERPQSGDIYIRDERVLITDPNIAMAHGIGMVHQHFMLVDDLTVAENVILGIEPKKHGLLDREAARALVRSMAEQYDMSVDPDSFIRDLSVATKQKVEILKVLARRADIVILDEPTAVLTPQETKRFFEQLSALRKAGRTIIIITHKLSEIKTICDRITIMRKGRTVGTYDVASISEQEISRRMIGGDPSPDLIPEPVDPGPVLLSVQNVSCIAPSGKFALRDVHFDLRGGEMLGIVGVEGNGQRELVDILTGLRTAYDGTVILAGTTLRGMSIARIRHQGLSFVPEDRMTVGVNLDGSLLDNATAAIRDDRSFNVGPFQADRKLAAFARRLVSRYEVQHDSLRESIRHLSGGNMQKVVCGREIGICKTVLVADQPTRGVDVGAVRTIHDQIESLRRHGKAILLISSDLTEIRTLCRQAIVLHQGEIVARIDDLAGCSEEELGLYMLGLKRQDGRGATS